MADDQLRQSDRLRTQGEYVELGEEFEKISEFAISSDLTQQGSLLGYC